MADAARPECRVLLVYGTLREGVPTVLGEVLPRLTTVARDLVVPGVLYDVGAYPAAVVDHAAVCGQAPVRATFRADLVAIDEAAGTQEALAAYDAYEEVHGVAGDSYRRVLVPLDHPQHAVAWIYDWIGPVTTLTRIASGRWRDSRP